MSYSSRLHPESLVPGQRLEYADILWIKWVRRKEFMVQGKRAESLSGTVCPVGFYMHCPSFPSSATSLVPS